MTWGDLKLTINDFRRESTENFITDAELMRYANLIISEIVGYYQWNWVEAASVPITLITNQSVYDLPDDFEIALSLTGDLTGGQGQVPFEFTYLRPQDFFATPPSSGYYYTIYGNKLRILVPSIQSIGGSVTLNYYSNYIVVDSLSVSKFAITEDTDTFLIPPRFQEVIVQGVLKFVFQKEQKPDDTAYANTRYNEILRQMILDEPNKVAEPLRQFRHYLNGF